MSSELKANKISPATSTDITLGDSGDTFTVPSGATLAVSGTMTLPANSVDSDQYVDGSIDEAHLASASVTSAKLSGNLVTPGTLDVNGQEFILDADGDTSITADTDDQIDFKVAGSDAVTIDSSGNVGIGIAGADGKLHAQSATAGTVTADADADELVLENSSSTGMSILSPSEGKSTIYFGNPGTNGQKDGGIKYWHESHATTANRRSLTFHTGGDAEGLRIDNNGAVTMPLQPYVSVKPASHQTNFAVGSDVTIVWDDELYDTGANFASNTFTAPATGKYSINYLIRLNQIDTAADYYYLSLITSNYTYNINLYDPGGLGTDILYFHFHGSVITHMDSADTFYCAMRQGGGAQQTDVESGSFVTISLIS